MKHIQTFEFINEAQDNLYLQLHKKYAKQIQGLKAKKIKKLTDLVSVQRWSMEDRDDYFDLDPKKKKELSAEYNNERKLFKRYMARDHSVMLPTGTESLPESVNEAKGWKGADVVKWKPEHSGGYKYLQIMMGKEGYQADHFYHKEKGAYVGDYILEIPTKNQAEEKKIIKLLQKHDKGGKVLDESVNEAFSKKDWDVKWKMPKDNLFNATKTKNAVDNRYKALQSLLKDKPKELKAFDADENHPAYDMTYDELMKWYNELQESVNETKTKAQEQIVDALKIYFQIAFETGLESNGSYNDFEKEFWKKERQSIINKIASTKVNIG